MSITGLKRLITSIICSTSIKQTSSIGHFLDFCIYSLSLPRIWSAVQTKEKMGVMVNHFLGGCRLSLLSINLRYWFVKLNRKL